MSKYSAYSLFQPLLSHLLLKWLMIHTGMICLHNLYLVFLTSQAGSRITIWSEAKWPHPTKSLVLLYPWVKLKWRHTTKALVLPCSLVNLKWRHTTKNDLNFKSQVHWILWPHVPSTRYSVAPTGCSRSPPSFELNARRFLVAIIWPGPLSFSKLRLQQSKCQRV